MDDLQHFFQSRRCLTSLLGSYRDGTGYKEYENVHLGREMAKTSSSHWSRARNGDCLACDRCNDSILTAKDTRSVWHHALERAKDKRNWRNASAKLSDAWEIWLARKQEDDGGHDEDTKGTEKVAERPQLLAESTIIRVSKVDETTTSQGVVVDTTEITIKTENDVANVDSDSYCEDTTFKVEHAHNESVVKIEVTEVESEHEADDSDTPARPTRATSSPASSPVTPNTGRSQITLSITPDTPESTLRPDKVAAVTKDPSTPTPSFQFAPLPEGLFLPTFHRGTSERLRLSYPVTSRRPPSPRLRNVNSTPRRRSLSPNTQKDPRMRLFQADGDSTAKVRPRIAYFKDSNDNFLYEDEEDKVFPITSPIVQSALEGISKAGTAERRTEFMDSLQLYDKAKQHNENSKCSTWDYFSSDATCCYGGTKSAGRRCKFRKIKGTEDSIRETIMKLEAHDPEADPDGCLRLVEELSGLTLCYRESVKWPGHAVGVNAILVACKALLSPVRPTGNGISIVIKHRSSQSGRPNVVTRSMSRLVPEQFAGFEVWQPKTSLNVDLNVYLRKLASRAVNFNNPKNSGFIYAYRTECIFGYIKIGYTTVDIDSRLKQWKAKCRHEIFPILGSSIRLPYIKRVESLIHAELKEFRRKQRQCCDRPHDEWFETVSDNVRAVVEKWCAWMETEPYDTLGKLKHQHLKMLDDWCQPTKPKPTQVGTSECFGRHVQSLEKVFELVTKTPLKTLKLISNDPVGL